MWGMTGGGNLTGGKVRWESAGGKTPGGGPPIDPYTHVLTYIGYIICTYIYIHTYIGNTFIYIHVYIIGLHTIHVDLYVMLCIYGIMYVSVYTCVGLHVYTLRIHTVYTTHIHVHAYIYTHVYIYM